MRPVILIAGATATGKSAFALRLAREVGGVVVNADSQQLYDGLRVLTARPTPEEEAAVPHRLYGVADPGQAWSVGRWLRSAESILAEEGRPLLFVGGTGLYFHALTRGLAPVPQVEASARKEVESLFDEAGEAEIRRRLAQADPAAEARIAPGDRQRLIRALAVWRSTGRALSDWQAQPGRPPLRSGEYLTYVVERPRDELYARCDRRVHAMIDGGALSEVRALLARDLDPGLPAMKAVGVRELGDVLENDLPLGDAIEAMQRETRRYAKRQLTWFRNQTPDWPRVCE